MRSEKEYCHSIIEVLLWNSVKQPSLTLGYEEFSRRLDQKILARNLSSYLEKVYHLCTKMDCPPLPVMVLNQRIKQSSPWFYHYYELINQVEAVNERAIFHQELKNVYRYPDWEHIARLLDLDHQLIIRLKKRSDQLKSLARA